MIARIQWFIQLGVALAIGAAAAAGAVAWLHHHRDAQLRDDPVAEALDESDRMQDVVAGLRQDGVYVSDDGRYLLDEQGESAVVDAVRASTNPAYVLVWAPDQEIGADEFEVGDYLTAALEQDLADAGEKHGVLYVYQGPERGDTVELRGNGYVRGFSSTTDFTGDPAITLPLAVEAVDAAEWYDDDGGSDDYWGGPGGGGLLGLFLGLAILGPFLLGGRIVRGVLGANLLPGTWRAEERSR